MRKLLPTTFLITGVLSCGTLAVASDETPLSGNCGYMCHVPMAGEGGSSMMAPLGLRPVEGDLSQMKARFAIKKNQEPAWQRFEDAVNTPLPNSHKTARSELPATSLERAKFMERLWQKRYDHMAAITKAFGDLYEVLDAEQKRVADQRFGYCEIAR